MFSDEDHLPMEQLDSSDLFLLVSLLRFRSIPLVFHPTILQKKHTGGYLIKQIYKFTSTLKVKLEVW